MFQLQVSLVETSGTEEDAPAKVDSTLSSELGAERDDVGGGGSAGSAGSVGSAGGAGSAGAEWHAARTHCTWPLPRHALPHYVLDDDTHVCS